MRAVPIVALLALGLAAAMLVGSMVGPYPIPAGDVIGALVARLRGDGLLASHRHHPVPDPAAARPGGGLWSALPWPLPARVTRRSSAIRWSRRTYWVSRPARASAPSSGILPGAARDRHPGAGLRHRPCDRCHRLRAGAGTAQPERGPGAGVGRHRRRRACRCRHLAGEDPGRSLQSASRHHLLAAGQPVRHQG